MFEIAADHCKPLFPAAQIDPPAVDCQAIIDVEALITAAEQELLSAIADRFAALRAAARIPTVAEPISDSSIADLITPGRAVHLTGVARPTLYRLCKDHPIGSPEGFSLWRVDEQRFLISQSRLERFLQSRPLRMRRNETKKPGPETR
ncbi:hypothetical protein IVA96_15690 [Bradyrhizobium sp. 159]|uniref:hypothetical protein n=1 Tax=unclassified Bradyrhizobium TaxID=2631580 RepID=UPI001FFB48AF|nr:MULTISPECIES: hypothetical protein [unclassified Bradyrhizobium]MCK1424601.1 hypothetical protein [Bradyrhizobium sp. CW12]MCK1618061.1 hypothetical protein [Bradyrhizobium sp. 159]MCK1646464.1 hypothetical protein [Bradyrhizobium sp. 154]MCK1758759.1 hypothetical protein [Bradyrhizobium sp. 137]